MGNKTSASLRRSYRKLLHSIAGTNRSHECRPCVSDPTSLDKDIRSFKTSLAGFSFNSGQQYSEYRIGDKVAEYGLAALIVGGAAAAAAKSGAFKFLGKFIGVGVIGGLAAAWAAVRSFVSRKRA